MGRSEGGAKNEWIKEKGKKNKESGEEKKKKKKWGEQNSVKKECISEKWEVEVRGAKNTE